MWHEQERPVMYIKYWLEHVKERGQIEDLYTDGTLKGNIMK